MYALTGRRFANMVCKKAVIDVKVVRYYSSHALDMKLKNDLMNKIRDTMPNLPFQASSIFSVNSRRNLNLSRPLSTAAASSVGDNNSATTTPALPVVDSGSGGGVAGIGEAKQVTKIETSVSVKINLNGSGVTDSDTGIPFLDEMLHKFASHGLFDLDVKATGDIDVDERHTNEVVAEAIGTALWDAVGDRKDIKRFGSFCAPHHEALVLAALDLSGHSYLDFGVYYFKTHEMVGTYDTELLEPFFDSLVNISGMTLHLRNISGSNTRDIIEATFKAFAGALRQATEYDPRRLPLLLEHSQLQNE